MLLNTRGGPSQGIPSHAQPHTVTYGGLGWATREALCPQTSEMGTRDITAKPRQWPTWKVDTLEMNPGDLGMVPLSCHYAMEELHEDWGSAQGLQGGASWGHRHCPLQNPTPRKSSLLLRTTGWWRSWGVFFFGLLIGALLNKGQG